jgi:hypothetical protein
MQNAPTCMYMYARAHAICMHVLLQKSREFCAQLADFTTRRAEYPVSFYGEARNFLARVGAAFFLLSP